MKCSTVFIILSIVISCIIIFLSLLLTSMHTVDILNFGLMYRNLDYKVTNQIFSSGRHFSGIGTRFIEYPTKQIVFEFAADDTADLRTLDAWTSTGQ